MTDWVQAMGSQGGNKPPEFETDSSEFVVYQRRNFSQGAYGFWLYEERTLTKAEYLQLRIAENSAAIDDIIISLLEG